MPSPPSSLTPLGFTREYQTYRAANTNIPFIDSRLLSAVRFWSRFSDALESDSYSSFWLEDLPPLLANTSSVLEDLDPNELSEIAEFVTRLGATRVPATLTAASVWKLAARKWLYVGETNKAMHCLAAGDLRGPELSLDLQSQSIDPPHLPNALVSQLGNEHEPLKDWLTRFAAEWRAIRESGVANQAMCVLVERDAAGRPIRGRLRVLEAHVETLAKDREEDEVVFGHQLCAADDPQVRGAYAALAALRNAEFGIRNAESKTGAPDIPHSAFRNPHLFLRAKFTFADGGNREPYGGDSLAFACFAAAYGDWWSKDLHRERRLVSSQAALTGALDSHGKAQAISENSLSRKVERVFFSPLSYLVIPQANRAVAESELERLHVLYPNRRLRPVTVDRASDLSSDGNIMIPERVCFGEYAVRAATKYTRNLKVQVPLLAALGYLLLCLLYPKAWVGFDQDPQFLRHTSFGFTALNEDSIEVWSVRYPCECDSGLATHAIGNIDDDAASEVVFILKAPEVMTCSLNTVMFVYDDDGEELFHRQCVILGEYVGDTSIFQRYTPSIPTIFRLGDSAVIVTAVNISYPARSHVRIWNPSGSPRGWYVNAGFVGGAERNLLDATGRRLFMTVYNNRMKCSAFVVLPLDSSAGVSPPFEDPDYDLRWCRRGNQLAYVLFPRTDVNHLVRLPYNTPEQIVAGKDGSLRVRMVEMDRPRCGLDYFFDRDMRLEKVKADDRFITERDFLLSTGALPAFSWHVYLDSLAAQVRYWTDTGWVKHSDMLDP